MKKKNYNTLIKSTKGIEEIRRQILKKNVNFGELDEFGKSLIHYAAEDNIDLLNFILENGGNVHVEDSFNKTALFVSIQNSSREICLLLLRKGANPNHSSKWKFRPLHTAVERGDLRIVQFLVNFKAKVNCFNSWRQTPFHISIEKEFIHISLYLLSKGAKVRSQTTWGTTPFMTATQNGYINGILLLLFLDTPYRNIRNKQNQSAFDLILRKEKNNKNDQGFNEVSKKELISKIKGIFLMKKKKSSREEFEKLFLRQVILKNLHFITRNENILHYFFIESVKRNYLIIVKFFLKQKNLDINYIDPRNDLQAMHYACNRKYEKLIFLLILAGTDLEQFNQLRIGRVSGKEIPHPFSLLRDKKLEDRIKRFIASRQLIPKSLQHVGYDKKDFEKPERAPTLDLQKSFGESRKLPPESTILLNNVTEPTILEHKSGKYRKGSTSRISFVSSRRGRISNFEEEEEVDDNTPTSPQKIGSRIERIENLKDTIESKKKRFKKVLDAKTRKMDQLRKRRNHTLQDIERRRRRSRRKVGGIAHRPYRSQIHEKTKFDENDEKVDFYENLPQAAEDEDNQERLASDNVIFRQSLYLSDNMDEIKFRENDMHSKINPSREDKIARLFEKDRKIKEKLILQRDGRKMDLVRAELEVSSLQEKMSGLNKEHEEAIKKVRIACEVRIEQLQTEWRRKMLVIRDERNRLHASLVDMEKEHGQCLEIRNALDEKLDELEEVNRRQKIRIEEVEITNKQLMSRSFDETNLSTSIINANQYEDEIKELKSRLEVKEEEVKEIRGKFDEKLESIESKVEKREDEMKRLEQKLKKTNGKKIRAREQVILQTSKISDLEGALERRNERIEDLEQINRTMERQIKSMKDEHSQRIESYESEISKMEKNKDREISRLEEEVKKAQREGEEGRFSELEAEKFRSSEELRKMKEEWEGQKKGMEEKMKVVDEKYEKNRQKLKKRRDQLRDIAERCKREIYLRQELEAKCKRFQKHLATSSLKVKSLEEEFGRVQESVGHQQNGSLQYQLKMRNRIRELEKTNLQIKKDCDEDIEKLKLLMEEELEKREKVEKEKRIALIRQDQLESQLRAAREDKVKLEEGSGKELEFMQSNISSLETTNRELKIKIADKESKIIEMNKQVESMKIDIEEHRVWKSDRGENLESVLETSKKEVLMLRNQIEKKKKRISELENIEIELRRQINENELKISSLEDQQQHKSSKEKNRIEELEVIQERYKSEIKFLENQLEAARNKVKGIESEKWEMMSRQKNALDEYTQELKIIEKKNRISMERDKEVWKKQNQNRILKLETEIQAKDLEIGKKDVLNQELMNKMSETEDAKLELKEEISKLKVSIEQARMEKSEIEKKLEDMKDEKEHQLQEKEKNRELEVTDFGKKLSEKEERNVYLKKQTENLLRNNELLSRKYEQIVGENLTLKKKLKKVEKIKNEYLKTINTLQKYVEGTREKMKKFEEMKLVEEVKELSHIVQLENHLSKKVFDDNDDEVVISMRRNLGDSNRSGSNRRKRGRKGNKGRFSGTNQTRKTGKNERDYELGFRKKRSVTQELINSFAAANSNRKI